MLYHEGSVSKALLDLFPNIGLQREMFLKHGMFLFNFSRVIVYIYLLINFYQEVFKKFLKGEDSLRRLRTKMGLTPWLPTTGTS
jgi:hypothetical protein